MTALGILGGTFDPPHIAHLILAVEAQAQLELSKILWVLTPAPPHKVAINISSVTVRQELVQAAISDNPSFEFCRVDIERDPPYYAVDTMRILRDHYPDADLIYLMGEDSLRDLPKWHHPSEFLRLCTGLGVMRRVGAQVNMTELAKALPEIEPKIRYIGIPLLEISSSDIRRRISGREPFRYFLTEKVYQLVLAHNLYSIFEAKTV